MQEITLHNYEAFLLDYFEGNLDASRVAELKRFVLQHPELELDLSDGDLPVISPVAVEAEFKDHLKKYEEALEDEEILNYLERLLPEKAHQAFEMRLTSDPSLVARVQAYQKTILPKEAELQFSAKDQLYRTEDDLVMNNPLITYLEGTLDADAKQSLDTELKRDKALKRDLDLFMASRLTADLNVVYPNKEELKKETKVLALFSRRVTLRVAAALILLACLGFLINLVQDVQTPNTSLAQNTVEDETPKTVTKNKDLSVNPSVIQNTKSLSVEPQNEAPQPETKAIVAKTFPTNSVKGRVDTLTPTVVEPTLQKNNEAVQKQNLAENTLLTNQTEQSSPVEATKASTHKYTELALVEELEETNLPTSTHKREKGLWKKAVQLARQVNKLGVKSVDGVEDSRQDRYRISFNSFSVEKK